MRLYIQLPEATDEALKRLAHAEHRRPHDQAVWLIEHGLIDLGALEAPQVAAVPQPRPADGDADVWMRMTSD